MCVYVCVGMCDVRGMWVCVRGVWRMWGMGGVWVCVAGCEVCGNVRRVCGCGGVCVCVLCGDVWV